MRLWSPSPNGAFYSLGLDNLIRDHQLRAGDMAYSADILDRLPDAPISSESPFGNVVPQTITGADVQHAWDNIDASDGLLQVRKRHYYGST